MPHERKFFNVADQPSNAYKRHLGPGSYSPFDGFKPTLAAEQSKRRAMRDLRKHGESPFAGETMKMIMRDSRRGPGYTKEFVPTKQQLDAIDAMLGKNEKP
jgi:hypothetical protein